MFFASQIAIYHKIMRFPKQFCKGVQQQTYIWRVINFLKSVAIGCGLSDPDQSSTISHYSIVAVRTIEILGI